VAFLNLDKTENMTKPFMLSLFYRVDDTAIVDDSTQNFITMRTEQLLGYHNNNNNNNNNNNRQ